MKSMGLELLSPDERLLFPAGRISRAHEEGAVSHDANVYQAGQVSGIVRVVKPTIVIESLLADFAPFVLVVSLILSATAALSAAWIGRAIASPIEELSVYSQRVSQGERPQLPKHIVGREVARLAQAIDVMRERLEGRPFVETFAADLSHELKNPVAAILASTEVLQEGALGEPVEAARFVRRIREAATRIERLLGELLSLAQVETRGPEHLELVAMNELVLQTVDALEPTLKVKVDIQTRAWVRGDKTWLRRALSNLLDNAQIHGTNENEICVVMRLKQRELHIEVSNAGQLDEHVHRSLFRRFVTTRRGQGGTGLGLSIVRAVAEAHGGHVELLDAGPPLVRFLVRLPVLTELPAS
jgi:two-component system, OmpR family, sensor histidine kinase CreC